MNNRKLVKVALIYALVAYGIVSLALDLSSLFNKKEAETKTPYDIQIEKQVTTMLENGSKVTLAGYNLLDIDQEFKVNDKVCVEIDENNLPSCLRHASDSYLEDGQMYVGTKWCGSYPAKLIFGKVIAVR
ncbi:MAG: hypothetical protein WCN88_04575 [Candidatus Falkowbacteria bacterium]